MAKVDNPNSGHKERMRKRYENEGLDSFEPHEVLEMILAITNSRKDTKEIAKKLLDQYHSLNGVMNTSVKQLKTHDNIGLKTASVIRLFKDVNVYLKREVIKNVEVFTNVQQVEDYLVLRYKGQVNEEFRVLYLNSKNILLKDGAISTGTAAKTYIDYTVLAKEILAIGATGIIVLHNHPSGNNSPSQQDLVTTKSLRQFLVFLGVRFLDHFIIGADSLYSFAKNDLL